MHLWVCCVSVCQSVLCISYKISSTMTQDMARVYNWDVKQRRTANKTTSGIK